MSQPLILTPADTPDRSLMGGKGWALAMAAQDFVVPAFVVISPAAFGPKGLTTAGAKALRGALANLKGKTFAVRSSAVDEDGAEASFAGQLQSFLNVSPHEVEARVHDVWASAFVDSVSDYRARHGLSATPKAPAVIVQAMVNADMAGVAFSVDPLSAGDKIAVIAVKGLADQLVGGEMNGDTYRLSRACAPLSAELAGEAAVLGTTQQRAVAKLALQAEAHFGLPQDIEWAIKSGILYLLQSRPITTLQHDDDTVIWDNSNIVESYSGVTSPLTFSFARRVYAEVYRTFGRTLGVSETLIRENDNVFANMLGSLNGHVYYNLLNWYKSLAMLPGFKSNRVFMEQMMGVREALPAHWVERIAARPSGWLARFSDTLGLARALLGLVLTVFSLPSKIKRFHRHIDGVLQPPAVPFAKQGLTTLVGEYRKLEKALLGQWDAPLINDFHCMVAFGLSRAVMKRWCGEKGESLHSDFMIGQGDIVSAEPAQRIARMAKLLKGKDKTISGLVKGDAGVLAKEPALAAQVTEYLAKFGDRCTQELKLESLTLDDDPTPLLQAIGYAAQRVENTEQNTHSDSALQARLAEAFVGRPLRRMVAKLLILWAKGRIRDRENLRFERTRVFGRIRRIFVAVGGILADAKVLKTARDVFHLSIEEILGLVDGTLVTRDLKGLVEVRKRDAERFEKLPPPPNRLETRGLVMTDVEAQVERARVMAKAGSHGAMKGLGCCRGVLTAKVRVVHDPRKDALRPGEILVARHTDPGWIALFSNAAGILVERGSLLSHSAIVAREMGIPCVVAIPDVMERLATGDTVMMDGTTGEVVKL